MTRRSLLTAATLLTSLLAAPGLAWATEEPTRKADYYPSLGGVR